MIRATGSVTAVVLFASRAQPQELRPQFEAASVTNTSRTNLLMVQPPVGGLPGVRVPMARCAAPCWMPGHLDTPACPGADRYPIGEQLGLKPESQKGPREMLHIERAERPTENS